MGDTEDPGHRDRADPALELARQAWRLQRQTGHRAGMAAAADLLRELGEGAAT